MLQDRGIDRERALELVSGTAEAGMLVTLLDLLLGQNAENPDPQTNDEDLFWYRLVTLIWFPMQAMIVSAWATVSTVDTTRRKTAM